MAKITWEQVWKWIERVQTFKWLVGLVVAGGMVTFITTVLQVLGYVSGPWLIVLACGIFALVLSGPVFAVERGWDCPKAAEQNDYGYPERINGHILDNRCPHSEETSLSLKSRATE